MKMRTVSTAVVALSLISASGAFAQAYPLTLTNCGAEVIVDSAPQRIVTGTQQAAEILIRLGVTDRMVGTAYEVDVVPEDIVLQYQSIPKLVERGQLIRHEALLEAQPDFVYSTLGGDFTSERGGTREELKQLGVPTYVSEFDCSMHAGVKDPSFELLFEEYRNLGKILGVSDVAETLITQEQQLIADALKQRGDNAAPMTVMWFFSDFEGTPWVAGGGGLPQHVSNLVGVENVYADAPENWIETSYDEIAVRNPDVIVIADLKRGYVNDTAAEKIALLKNDPLTQELDAVVNGRLITMPGSNMDQSFGSVQMVPDLVAGLAQFE